MIVISKFIPIGLFSLGIFLLMQVILPLASYKIWEIGQNYTNSLLISPKSSDTKILGVSIENKDNFSSIVSNIKRESVPNYSQFTISIPKLNIDYSQVMVDSNDLSSNLAHLPGSALPGEKGNVFISGHSSLSNLFSLKKAEFARLTELKKGDLIEVDVLGVKFKYVVDQLKIIDPKDLSVINPPDTQGRYISLMTCVPPGLNLKRLVVLGKMI